jgi:hypothetical protein
LLKFKTDAAEKDIIKYIEQVNFHRNQIEIKELLELKILSDNKDFIIRLGANLAAEDFTILQEVNKNEIKDVKLQLIKKAIKNTNE